MVKPRSGVAGKLILGLVLALVAAGLVYGLVGFTGSSSIIPAGVARGIYTEFPVDTASPPARPNGVATRSLRIPGATFPPNTLPEGISELLARTGDPIVSAAYRANPVDAPVIVSVLVKDSDAPASQALAAAMGGTISDVQVQSPVGEMYAGHKVRSGQSVAFILDKAGAPILIILYAADASADETAARLAANVGNSNGLFDEPELGAALAAAPSELPADTILVEAETSAGRNLEGSLTQLRTAMGGDAGPAVPQWISRLPLINPPRLTRSLYRVGGGEHKMALGDYGGSSTAWALWGVLRATGALSAMHSVPLDGGDALASVEDNTEYLVFHKGAYLGVVSSPLGQSALALQLAQSVAQARP